MNTIKVGAGLPFGLSSSVKGLPRGPKIELWGTPDSIGPAKWGADFDVLIKKVCKSADLNAKN